MSLRDAVDDAALGRTSGDIGDWGFLASPGEPPAAGMGPYRLALRRLRHNRTALFFGGLFLVIVVMTLLAPVYAHDIAHIGPNEGNITGVLHYGGKSQYIISPTGIPIGPTLHSRYFLGADPLGRDLAVRLLYGGRTSLAIGGIATATTIIMATILGLLSGYYRGITDGIISRVLDIIWAFPALLLAIALGVSLALGGISIGPLHLQGNSIYIPSFIIGIVYIPYVARPIRGEVLVLREREFVDAARVLGFGNLRIMFGEILPNLTSTLVVFVALQLAQSIILEAALSYLGAGVLPPNASWGTLLSSGSTYFDVAPHLTLAPAIMLILAALGINIFGDGLRDALDPRARIRVAR
jgi:peptide/nickel transport system permease protein